MTDDARIDPAALDADGLFHLVTPGEWATAQQAGEIHPPSLESEGFVHCSWGHQVAGTVDKVFAQVESLLALRLDPDGLGDVELVEEDSYGSGQAFPHAYGPIPLDAVIDTLHLR